MSKKSNIVADEFALTFIEEMSGMTPEDKKRQKQDAGWWASLDQKMIKQKPGSRPLPVGPTEEEISALYKP